MTGAMKKGWLVISVVLTFIVAAAPIAFSGSDDISRFPNCPICGMDRHKFAYSRMLIQYKDGSAFGACSLHCAALETAYRPGKIPVEIMVGDYDTRELIDAEQAVWVMGGKKMGVMTSNAKWAFGDEKRAQQYMDKHGGKIVNFETALSAAYADLYKDTKTIREKRKKMRHKKKGAMSHKGEKQDQ